MRINTKSQETHTDHERHLTNQELVGMGLEKVKITEAEGSWWKNKRKKECTE